MRRAARVDPTRTYLQTTRLRGRIVTPGMELTIRGLPGRSRFIAHVVHVTGAEWIDVRTADDRFRTVRPERVRVVHVKRKARPDRPVGKHNPEGVAA